jgi:hypothetical protein
VSPGSTFEVPAHVVARRIGDDSVILDLQSGTYFGLDPVGARIFELVAQGRALGDIQRTILAEYEVAADVLEADLERLLDDLQSHGLVTAR